VPALPEPPPPPPAPVYRVTVHAVDDDRRRHAAAYAEACFRGVKAAPAKERHPALRAAAKACFGLVEHGLLDEQEAWDGLENAANHHAWPEKRRDELLTWCRADAARKKPLPKGF
jgi:hypothetical protein